MSLPWAHIFRQLQPCGSGHQRRVAAELRKRGVNAWEREIELSPQANDSQWVRRELSFAEELDKRLFPVHIREDENVSIPLRLSAVSEWTRAAPSIAAWMNWLWPSTIIWGPRL